MDLSDRLQAVASMVTPGNIVADIGCDHAYISIYLIKSQVSEKVIAMDVNQGPLAIARNNISGQGYENKIQTRLSDGIDKLSKNEVDTIIIAGMGGSLTCKILKEGIDKLENIKELILQPQSEIELVRKLLVKLGFEIAKEKMLIDDDKYYVVIKAINNREDDKLHNDKKLNQYKNKINIDESYNLDKLEANIEEVHYLYGKHLLEEKNSTLHSFLMEQKEVVKNIKNKLKDTNTKNAKLRLEEVNKELEYIDIALRYY